MKASIFFFVILFCSPVYAAQCYTDPANLDPLRGTVWEMSYDYISSSDNLTFGSKTESRNGQIGLWVDRQDGKTGVAMYCDLPWGGKGFWVYVSVNERTDDFYMFTISSNVATGKFRWVDIPTEFYSPYYELTGRKIKSITTTSTTTTTVPLVECTDNSTGIDSIEKLEGTLWKEKGSEDYIGFYDGYYYEYFGSTSPDEGFVKYGRFNEFKNNFVIMRWGFIVGISFLGKWDCADGTCLMKALSTIRLVVLPLTAYYKYELVCSKWQM